MKVHPSLAPLLPLVPLYRAGLAVKEAALRQGWQSTKRLGWPVVSVGNLSVGGAGKTPVVMHLARLLSAAGATVDVLSRGYGRSSHEPARVDPAGSAAQYGDEPLLMARAGVPVFVAPRRYDAGLMAEATLARTPEPHIHLLDDGFQHRQLARTVDIVLLHRSDFSSALLPAGRLREPLRALSRADVVILREEDADLEAEARRYAAESAVFWRMRRRITVPAGVPQVAAFCALARPDEFFAALREAGLKLTLALSWRDHHRYGEADIERLKRLAAKGPFDAFVTTAKDMVKLEPAWRADLEQVAPLLTAELEVSFTQDAIVAETMLRLVTAHEARKTL